MLPFTQLRLPLSCPLHSRPQADLAREACAPARRSQRAQAEGLGRAASEPGGAARISRFVAKGGKNCRVGRYGMRG